jgi:hypothetical protein
VLPERPVHAQHDGLAGRRLADPDLGVEPGVRLGLAGDDGQDAARMLAGGLVGRPDRVVLGRLVGHDDEREDHAQGHAAEPVTCLGQRLVDGAGGGVGQINGHIVPSR